MIGGCFLVRGISLPALRNCLLLPLRISSRGCGQLFNKPTMWLVLVVYAGTIAAGIARPTSDLFLATSPAIEWPSVLYGPRAYFPITQSPKRGQFLPQDPLRSCANISKLRGISWTKLNYLTRDASHQSNQIELSKGMAHEHFFFPCLTHMVNHLVLQQYGGIRSCWYRPTSHEWKIPNM